MKTFKQLIEEIESIAEGKRPGLWDNIHAKRKRIKSGSGERMRKPGSKGSPTSQDFTNASQTSEAASPAQQAAIAINMKKRNQKPKSEEIEELFDLIEDVIEDIAKENNVDSDVIWEDLKDISDEDLFEVAAWQRKEGKNPKGGLNAKGIASYRRENPGSKLQMAVTTKPSKLKPGSKAANRRKSFCARMGGMKKRLTSAETARDPDSRINKALRKWNC